MLFGLHTGIHVPLLWSYLAAITQTPPVTYLSWNYSQSAKQLGCFLYNANDWISELKTIIHSNHSSHSNAMNFTFIHAYWYSLAFSQCHGTHPHQHFIGFTSNTEIQPSHIPLTSQMRTSLWHINIVNTTKPSSLMGLLGCNCHHKHSAKPTCSWVYQAVVFQSYNQAT